MIFLDTGYLIALIEPRDQLHARAFRWSECVAGPIVITSGVIWETVNFFSQPPQRAIVHELIARVQRTPGLTIVHVDPNLLTAGLRLHRERLDKAWSLTDCISFIVMRGNGIHQALTHDHHFEQAGFEALLRRDPP